VYRNIDAERTRLGLTKARLAELLDVSAFTLRSWTNKERPIPSTKLLQMAKLFNCTIDYLLEEFD
jgi:transcriptional regulator with XRE-family HTH domain